MNRKIVASLRHEFANIIKEYGDCEPFELIRIFIDTIKDNEIEKGWDTASQHKSWTDDELRIILSEVPTKENCLKFAKAFKRGYGAIEQIYRWAAANDKLIKQKRPNDVFVKQIRRVAKQLGWRA